jgi:hypothetical protein
VRFLLIGGQACVFYGAAEFSRDTDIVILAEPANLKKLYSALKALDAEPIAVPPLSIKYLKKGHAAHFRCRHADAENIRIDIMSVLRGVASFSTLWRRRTTIHTRDSGQYDLLSLPDLVRAKKTQQDKDWPMLRRLLEAYYVQNQHAPSADQIRFLLTELRTPSLLIELSTAHPEISDSAGRRRPLLGHAKHGDSEALAVALVEEKHREREADRLYWLPLKKELEKLRHGRKAQGH